MAAHYREVPVISLGDGGLPVAVGFGRHQLMAAVSRPAGSD
jgi:hypothetical protein